VGITDFSPPDTETIRRLFFSLRPQLKTLAIAVKPKPFALTVGLHSRRLPNRLCATVW